MFAVVPTLSHRMSRLRAQHRSPRAQRADVQAPATSTSLAETLAVGLGCDLYKQRG